MKKEYYNNELAKVVEIAKSIGLKVWTFETSSSKICQVFFDDGKTFGSASEDFGQISFSTCHKANRSCGTGFRIGGESTIANEIYIRQSLEYAPDWAHSIARKAKIVKETFAEHIKKDILKYYEL